MIQDEIEEARHIAAAKPIEQLRRDSARLPSEDLVVLLVYVEEHLFEPSLSVGSALKSAGLRHTSAAARLASHLGMPLRKYITRRRIQTAKRMLRLNVFPTGRVATAVGIAAQSTFRRAWQSQTSKPLRLFRLPERLTPDFNFATWNRAWRGRLDVEDVRRLLGSLRRLYSTSARRAEAALDFEPRIQPMIEPIAAREIRSTW